MEEDTAICLDRPNIWKHLSRPPKPSLPFPCECIKCRAVGKLGGALYSMTVDPAGDRT